MTRKADGALTPAVAYVRMSSNQQDASPEQQRAEIVKLAARDGYNVIRWYEDPGISGDDTRKRKAFLRMLRDAEEKADFKAILCWDQDRFGRFDTIEAGRYVFPLREAGVWIATVAQGRIDWNTFQGRLLYTVQQEGKHQYLIDLSRNVLRGKVASAKKGTSASIPPYGYDRQFSDEKGRATCRVKYGENFRRPRGWTVRFVLSEDDAILDTVRWIWKTFVDADWGVTTIARDLNRRNVPSPNGKAWSYETVRGILTNRVYTGANVFGRKRYGKYHHLGPNGEAKQGSAGAIQVGEPIVADAIHEPLVDRVTFDLAQAKLAGRQKTHNKPRNSPYLLSGILHCGHCGGTMAGRGYTAKGKYQKRYYTCTTRATHPGRCACHQVPKDAIEGYVLAVLEERISRKECVSQMNAEVQRIAKQSKTPATTSKTVQARLAAVERKIQRGTENLLLANPDDVADLSRLLAEMRKERAALQAELEQSTKSPEGMTSEDRSKKAMAELKRLQEFLKGQESARVRAVIKALVDEIQLWFEPYGKQKRLAKGVIRFASNLQVLPSGPRGH